jgi:hypothetical protein
MRLNIERQDTTEWLACLPSRESYKVQYGYIATTLAEALALLSLKLNRESQ